MDAFSLSSSHEQSLIEENQSSVDQSGSNQTSNDKKYEVEVNNEEKQKKEEELHKKSLFLYVFILR